MNADFADYADGGIRNSNVEIADQSKFQVLNSFYHEGTKEQGDGDAEASDLWIGTGFNHEDYEGCEDTKST